MKRTGLLALIWLTFYCTMSWGQEIYRWVDEKGTIHLTDDMSSVPERYRDQVQKKRPLKEPSPPLAPQVSKEKEETEKESKSASERKDLLGRGEGWWKAKAEEWNEKLLEAQKNYETAHADYKKKEKQVEEAKFQPKSLQRKLKSELKALEEKANGWKKQVEEAKNMLEKILPKEAEESNADPNWIKVEQ
jgi:hypothetical protein